MQHRVVRRRPTGSLSGSQEYGCARPLPEFVGGLPFLAGPVNSSPGAKAATLDLGSKSLRVRLRSPTPGCSQATGTESEPPLFPKGSYQSFCTFVVWPVAQNDVREAEYPLDVPAKAGRGWERHSVDSRGRCETASPRSFLPGRDESLPRNVRRLSASACFLGARIPATARHEEASAAAREGCRQFHPGRANLDVQARSGRSSLRSRR